MGRRGRFAPEPPREAAASRQRKCLPAGCLCHTKRRFGAPDLGSCHTLSHASCPSLLQYRHYARPVAAKGFNGTPGFGQTSFGQANAAYATASPRFGERRKAAAAPSQCPASRNSANLHPDGNTTPATAGIRPRGPVAGVGTADPALWSTRHDAPLPFRRPRVSAFHYKVPLNAAGTH